MMLFGIGDSVCCQPGHGELRFALVSGSRPLARNLENSAGPMVTNGFTHVNMFRPVTTTEPRENPKRSITLLGRLYAAETSRSLMKSSRSYHRCSTSGTNAENIEAA